jgi:UDP-N-acetylmuramate--alanine ligase
MDADHLDVYGTSSQVTEGFWGFIDQIKKNGKLLIKAGLPLREKLDTDLNIYTYSATANADYQVCNLKKHNGLYSFDLNTPDGTLVGFKLGVPGLVNVENAAAALALCLMNGVPCEALKKALPMFSGIARRFEVKISSPQLVYIDDYAHHPEEIRATLKSVRDAYSGRKITGVFQPHLFSRTRDFAEAFANALNESLDQIVLLPVYPAREEPVSGVSSENITQYLPTSKCMLIEKNDLINRLNELSPDVLITMGAGDIDRLVPDICQWGLNRGTMQNG